MVVGQLELPLAQIAEVCRKFKVKELRMFGSALRNDFRPDSDIDLLVEFLPHHGFGLIGYLECQEELAEVLGRRVDLVQASGLKTSLRDQILRSARTVYAN